MPLTLTKKPDDKKELKIKEVTKEIENHKKTSRKKHAEDVANAHHYQNEIVKHAPSNRGK